MEDVNIQLSYAAYDQIREVIWQHCTGNIGKWFSQETWKEIQQIFPEPEYDTYEDYFASLK